MNIDDFIVLDDEDGPSSSHTCRRNTEPQYPHKQLTLCKIQSIYAQSHGPTASTISIGDTVELGPTTLEKPVHAGDFLRVLKIIKNIHTQNTMLRGLLFRRNKFLQPALPRKLNEVYMAVTIDEEDHRPYHIQGLEEVSLADVVRKRRLVITNLPFPELSFREHTHYDSTKDSDKRMETAIAENEVLVCRQISAHIYGEGERSRKRKRPYQGMLRFILDKEADNGGGILTGKNAERVELDSDEDDKSHRSGRNARRYTVADGFQGGGGASCGAKLAGLNVVYGFDHDRWAVASASMNFPRARILQCEASNFPPPGFDARCDILHLSPPCEPYSSANTRPNQGRDEANTDALLAVGHIIRAVRPKLITLEQTSGFLTNDKSQPWFGILLSMAHAEGYSCRWAVHSFDEYAVSQRRKRLSMVAAAPGVPLPEMPKPTHSLSVWQAIGTIPAGSPNHELDQTRRIDRPAWDPNKPFDKTIMKSNSDVYHWDGKRTFTNRELAGIQGFPHWYAFAGPKSEVEKQIGNAVPPAYSKLLFTECAKVLRKMDRVRGQASLVDGPTSLSVRSRSRTLSPGLPSSSRPSMGSHADRAIVIDD